MSRWTVLIFQFGLVCLMLCFIYISSKFDWSVLIGAAYLHNKSNRTVSLHSRSQKLEALRQKVQEAIERLQEPADRCKKKTKVLICRNNFPHAGFGSVTHRYAACLQIAFGLGRVAIWRHKEYQHFGGYSRWMRPPSKACEHLKDRIVRDRDWKQFNVKNRALWDENMMELITEDKYLFLDIRFAFPYPRHIPGTIPNQLQQKLQDIGIRDPARWFYGQFILYLLGRPNAYFQKQIADVQLQLGNQRPSIGVHIRQARDKVGVESDFIKTGDFALMVLNLSRTHFESFDTKTVFVATDTEDNYDKMTRLLPGRHKVIFLPKHLRNHPMDGYHKKNFDPQVVESILLDIYFLWKSTLTVCTFSSNICRIIAELKYASGEYLNTNPVFSMDKEYFMSFPGFQPGRKLLLSVESSSDDREWSRLSYDEGNLFFMINASLETITSEQSLIHIKPYFHRRLLKRGLVPAKDFVEWPGFPIYKTQICF